MGFRVRRSYDASMQRVETRAPARPPATPAADVEVGWLAGVLSRFLFRHVKVDGEAAQHVRDLAEKSAVVYVVRYRSLFDFLLVSVALAKAGMPRPVFAPDLPRFWLHPLAEIARRTVGWIRRIRPRQRRQRRSADRERFRELVGRRKPVLVFMRSRAPGVGGVERVPEALDRARAGVEFLREVVISQWSQPRNVSFVPLAIVRGRGYRRKESRLATLVYTVQQTPGELRRLFSFLWNRRDTTIVVGRDVQLRELVERHRAEGAERIVRRLSRALQIFLYREERMVQGPTLLNRHQMREIVLSDPALVRYVERYAWARRIPEAKVWRTARRNLDGMAANYQGLYISFLAAVLNRLWKRMFGRLDWVGLDKVADTLRQHPIVLVPCHRSHFDYLILSYIFHLNHLSPPHIAAGDNLSFWPLGPIFRGAGAFFIRRSFGDDELYKLVFRSYMTFLIREGYTQEFFIEGGRSRSGKLLTPKLGMLSSIVGAFLRGVRRDLYLVPVSIQYSRVVEEQAYQHELEGGSKQKESLGALVRARSVLQQKYGDVQVTFADPISLSDTLGDLRERLQEETVRGSGDGGAERTREFVESLAAKILRDINDASAVNDTAIAATVLLGARGKAIRYRVFLERARAVVGLLPACGATREAHGDLSSTRAFLENAGLVRRVPEAPDVVYVPRERRLGLDFYKNNTIHWFLLPSLVASLLANGVEMQDLVREIGVWLDLYELEFPAYGDGEFEGRLERVVTEFRSAGAIDATGRLDPQHVLVEATAGVLDSFHEPYFIVAQVLSQLEPQGASEKTIRDRIAKLYKASFLLGAVRKPEGQSSITLGNALQRYIGAGYVAVATPPRRRLPRARDRWIVPGAEHASLGETGDRLARMLGIDDERR